MNSLHPNQHTRSQRVLLDVDGVLADFISAIREQLCLPENWAPRQWALEADALIRALPPGRLSDVLSRPGLAAGLRPYPDAREAVEMLRSAQHDVWFCTSPMRSSPTWCYERANWLVKHFGEEQGGKVIFTTAKHLVRGDVLIDDHPGNVALFRESGRDAYLIGRPWNGGSVTLKEAVGWLV